MVDWAAARADLQEKVAEIFDVTECRLVAMRSGLSVNAAKIEDSARPAFDFFGTVDLQPPGDLLRRHEPSDPASPGKVVAYDAVLTAHVGAWPWMPQRGDRVQAGGESFEVQASEKDGSSRPAFYLTRIRHAGG